MGLATKMRISSMISTKIAMALVIGGVSVSGVQAKTVDLPIGTVVPLKLESSLSSKTSQTGDKFAARVVTGRDDAGLPEGTLMEGVVREGLPSANGKPGVLDLDFKRVVFPNGKAVAVVGSLYSLDAKAVKHTSSGRLVATNDKGKDRLKFVGIGAGAGLVIAAVTKGNTITETVIGAGLGYLYNELANKKVGDVNLKAGTQFGIRLERNFAYDSAYRGTRTASLKPTGGQYYNPERAVREDDTDKSRDTEPRDIASSKDSDDIGLLIDDKNVGWDSSKPYMRGDVPMLPLDSVSKSAGFDYTYDAKERIIRAKNGKVRLGVGSRIAVVNGVRKRLPIEAEMHDGHLYVPMQFIGLAANGSVTWDASSRTVVLTTDRE